MSIRAFRANTSRHIAQAHAALSRTNFCLHQLFSSAFLFLRSFSFPKLWNNCMYLQPKTTAHTHSFVSPFFPNLIFFVVRERVTSSVIYTIFFLLCCCWCWVLSREWHSASTMRRRWRKSRLNNINRTMKRRRSSLCGEGFGLSRNQREKKESARRTWTCDAECIKFLVS